MGNLTGSGQSPGSTKITLAFPMDMPPNFPLLLRFHPMPP